MSVTICLALFMLSAMLLAGFKEVTKEYSSFPGVMITIKVLTISVIFYFAFAIAHVIELSLHFKATK